ncbi:hypothetical protein [uncultured Tenacibaculum sp.]|uniref:hypothetical protein n=1 Tax=uncultured Tenacibaculum sp. TaxID=174713 RepID=UPI00262E6216|nr:hypothetical protein [uncultured Tenacibaculum sp.]
MKNIKYYLLIILIGFCFSCKNGTTIHVINESGKTLGNISIETGFRSELLEEINEGESQSFFIDFNELKTKTDGIMMLKTDETYSNQIYSFGCYSSGIPPNKDITVILKKDTVEIK